MVKTAVGFRHSEKDKLEAQKDSKMLNFEENDRDTAMAREQNYLVNSDLNSEFEEDTKCTGFNDSLKSVFVRHQRDEIPVISRGWKPKEGLINYI